MERSVVTKVIKRVGVIGLGKMGRPMSRHLHSKGFETVGYDVAPEAARAGAALGVRVAASPAEVAGSTDLVIVVVGFDSELDAALFGPQGIMVGAKNDLVVAVSSTVAPAHMLHIAERAKGAAVTFLDAPLARGEPAAEEGKLLIFGGGEQVTFEACRPAFATFADAVHYLGKLGSGQVGKMVNNLILWACISANVEGLKLGRALGVEEEPLRHALLQSSASNWALETWAGERPMPWAEKDMSIVLQEADDARLSLPLCGVIKEVIKGIKIERGLGIPKPARRGV
jgi:3-hydroxyisobutyrate dehydrogenase-like beta-hydroxyacid dehydrogenase